jgi:hypothetical protein
MTSLISLVSEVCDEFYRYVACASFNHCSYCYVGGYVIEPWYVDCFREAVPIMAFIFVMYFISRNH